MVYAVVCIALLFVLKSLATSWINLQGEEEPITAAPHSVQQLTGGDRSDLPISRESPSLPLATKFVHAITRIDQPSVAGSISVAQSVRQQAYSGSVVQSEQSAQILHGTTIPVYDTLASSVSANSESLSPGLSEGASSHYASFTRSAEIPAVVVAASTKGSVAARVAATAGVAIPAAFGNVNSAGISSPEAAQQVEQIANDFTSQVQSSGVSPSSSSYRNVWDTAVNRANALFRQQFGNMAFEAMQQSAMSQ